jgi:hypothetical protein
MADVHDDPLREAISTVAALGAEIASVIQATQALQLRLIGVKPDKDAPLDEPLLEQLADVPQLSAAEQASANRTWHSALRDEWLSEAGPVDTARAWAAALDAAQDGDPTATRALLRSEARLQELHPEAMNAYYQQRNEGVPPAEAMLATAPHFDEPTTGLMAEASQPAVEPAPQTKSAGNEHGLKASTDLGFDAPVAQQQQHRGAGLGGTSGPTMAALPHRSQGNRGPFEVDDAEADTGPELFAPPAEQQEAPALGGDVMSQEPAPVLFADPSELETGPDLAAPVDLGDAPGAPGAEATELGTVAEPERPRPEATGRAFPTGAEAVDRVPLPKKPPSSSKPKKSWAKRLGRK